MEEIIVHVHFLCMPKRAYHCCMSINDIHYHALRKYYSTIYMQVVKMSITVCVGIVCCIVMSAWTVLLFYPNHFY